MDFCHINVPSDVIKIFFVNVPENNHILLSMVCKYWDKLLDEMFDKEKYINNSYNMKKIIDLTEGKNLIEDYTVITSPNCFNLYMYKLIQYDYLSCNTYVNMKNEKLLKTIHFLEQLIGNIIIEGHTFCPSYDIAFLKKYLELHDYHFVHYVADGSYKRLYHGKYSSLLTVCLLNQHVSISRCF